MWGGLRLYMQHRTSFNTKRLLLLEPGLIQEDCVKCMSLDISGHAICDLDGMREQKESSGLHFVLFGSLLLTILYFFMKRLGP